MGGSVVPGRAALLRRRALAGRRRGAHRGGASCLWLRALGNVRPRARGDADVVGEVHVLEERQPAAARTYWRYDDNGVAEARARAGDFFSVGVVMWCCWKK